MNMALFLLIACFWGGSFSAIQIAVESFPPVMAALLRVLTATVFLALIYPILRKPTAVPVRALPWVWTAGILSQGLPFALLFWAETRINPGVAGLINGTVPIWVFVFAWLFLRKSEPPTQRKLLGALIGLAGMVAIFAPQAKLNTAESASQWPYYAAVLGMALCYAAGNLMNRRSIAELGVNPYANAYQQPLASSAFLAIAYLLFIPGGHAADWASAPLHAWLAILYLGILSTAVAFMIYFKLLEEWGAIRAASVTYLMPIIALIVDFLFRGQIPAPNELLGGLLILCGMAVLQLPDIWLSRVPRLGEYLVRLGQKPI